MKTKLLSILLVICTIFTMIGLAIPQKELQTTFEGRIYQSSLGTNQTIVYYENSSWSQAYIHYCVNNGQWTTVPGIKMASSTEKSGYRWKYTINLGSSSNVQVCFNNGSGSWDSKNGSNYGLSVGSYGIKNQNVTTLQNVVTTKTPSSTPIQSSTPGKNQTNVYYYNSSWSQAYIHYRVNKGQWTTVPGVKMSNSTEQSGYTWKYTIDLGSTTEVEVCFNNGSGSWDSRNGSNYELGVGSYGIKNQNITTLSTIVTTKTPSSTPMQSSTPGKNQTSVYYYNSGWSQAYIHFRVNKGQWTTVPGVKMSNSTEQSGYTWKYTIDLGSATGVEVCFNNGSGSWDSKNGANYTLGIGNYGIKNGSIYSLVIATKTPVPTHKPTLNMKYGTRTYKETDNLPSYVNLREDQDLPPVTDQGSIGCCASASITYMQFTNAVSKYVRYNNIEGYNGVTNVSENWNPKKNKSNRFSDKWTYQYAGSGTAWVYNVLRQNGAPLLTECQFSTNSTGGYQFKNSEGYIRDVLSCNANKTTMMNALKTRLDDYEQIWLSQSNYELTDGLLKKIKCSLANGNVVITGSPSIYNMIFGTVENGGNSNAKGEEVVVSNFKGSIGHQVAIVGYDDNITAKFHGKTLKGAFLAVNSWGNTYKNNGYFWIMYDAVNRVSKSSSINPEYMAVVGSKVSFINRTDKDWIVTKEGSTIVAGTNYTTYSLKDKNSGYYLAYETSGNGIMLSKQKTAQCVWCFIPYKTAMQWSEYKQEYYEEKYKDTYFVYEVNKAAGISATGYRYLDAGLSISKDGRGIGTASFNHARYPMAKCWKMTNPGTKTTFETAIECVGQKMERINTLDQFVFTDWKKIKLGLPELAVQFDVTTADRLSFDVVLSRTDKYGRTVEFEPQFSSGKTNLTCLYDTEDRVNFAGGFSKEGNATGTFVVNYGALLNDISGSLSDYTWKLTIKQTSKLSVGANNTIQVKNVKLINQNGNTLAQQNTVANVTKGTKTWNFQIK